MEIERYSNVLWPEAQFVCSLFYLLAITLLCIENDSDVFLRQVSDCCCATVSVLCPVCVYVMICRCCRVTRSR